jgi:hypothetical protein
MTYTIYQDFSSNPENLNVILNSEANRTFVSSSPVKQFNRNMKFNHNNISYSFLDCTYDKQSRTKNAFDIISNETGIIYFTEVEKSADIKILCSQTKKPSENLDSEYFIAGEGGPGEIIQTKNFNVILNGSVLLYSSNEKTIKCSLPSIELHELLHVFGFDHSSNESSLMYPYLTSCKQVLDSSIIRDLKKLYSEQNLPDLYFDLFSSPVKKGRYLNINFTIKNSGTTDGKNVNFSIIEDGKKIETHELGDIRFGAGVIMKMENIKLKSSSPEKILIVIDYDNKIMELDKNNNIAEINF